MPKAELDKQGKLFWHLAKSAGWTDGRIAGLLMKRWQATHWCALNVDEKRAAINMMRTYANKQRNEACKKLRQTIGALVCKQGQGMDWLHENMAAWGYGDSLRALDYVRTLELYKTLKEVLCGEPKKEGENH